MAEQPLKSITLHARPNVHLDHAGYSVDHVRRIIELMAARGFAATSTDAQAIWLAHSAGLDSGWAALPAADDELFALLSPHFTPGAA
jgi:hypothetical protein